MSAATPSSSDHFSTLGLLTIIAALTFLTSCRELPDYQSSRPPVQGSLAAALDIEEHLDGGGSWVIPSDRHRQALDYKSRLRLIPAAEELEKLAKEHNDVLPTLDDRKRAQREQLAELLTILEDVEPKSNAVMAAAADLAAQRARGESPSAHAKTEFRQLLTAEAMARGRLLDYIRESTAEEAARKFPRGSDAYLEERSRLRDAYLTDDSGKDVLLNVARVAALLNDAIASSNADVAKVDRRTAQFRMRAWLHRANKSEPFPIHIDGYDDIDQHGGVKSPRVSFAMSDRDRARVEEGYELASDAARFIDDVRDHDSELRTRARDLAATVRRELSEFVSDDALQALSNEVLAAMRMAIARAVEESAEGDERQSVTSLGDKVADAQRLLERILALRDLLARPTAESPLEVVAFVSGAATTLQSLVSSVDGLPKAADFDVVATLLEQAAGAAADAAARTAIEAIQRSFEDSRAKLTAFVAVVARYRFIEEAYAQLSPQSIDWGGLARDVDTRVHTLDLDDVKPGDLDLDASPADRGDEVHLLAELVDPRDGHVVDHGSWTFAIERFGVTNTYSAHLIFVDRIGNGAATDPDTEFDPAPSVSWTLHYNPRVEPEGDTLARLWRFLDPGLGVNVAALDFEDADFQVGVGGHGTLFGDLVQIGYGYNLNADRDHQYFFVGIGILETLRSLNGFVGGRTGQ